MLYDNDLDYRENAVKYWNDNVKKFRSGLICLGTLMTVLGILCIIWPIQSVVVMGYVLSVAMIVFGIFRIAAYTQIPYFLRTGVGMLNGILDILLGIMLIFSGKETIAATLSFLFAFDLIAAGIEEISAGNKAKFFEFDGSGTFTASGVINIIVGIILLFMPVASIITLSILIIVFLLTKGIMLIVEGVRAKELKL